MGAVVVVVVGSPRLMMNAKLDIIYSADDGSELDQFALGVCVCVLGEKFDRTRAAQG